MTILQTETEEVRDLSLAREIAETLHSHYPGHLWAVRVASGVAIIKNLLISAKWGMVLHYSGLSDAMVRKKKTIRMGGELLERAHMKRDAWHGEPVEVLEGAGNYHWQPRKFDD